MAATTSLFVPTSGRRVRVAVAAGIKPCARATRPAPDPSLHRTLKMQFPPSSRGGSLRVPAGQYGSKDLKRYAYIDTCMTTFDQCECRSQTVPVTSATRRETKQGTLSPISAPTPTLPPTCAVCLIPIAGTHFQAGCGHTYDIPCLLKLIEYACAREAVFPPRCCGIVLDKDHFRAHMPQALGTLFHTRTHEYAIPPPQRVYCALATCSAYLGPRLPPSGPKYPYVCHLCPTQTCARCARELRVGLLHSCRSDPVKADADELLSTEAAKQGGWVACPRCARVVEPERLACAHATCVCGGELCAWCGAAWGKGACRCKEEREEMARKERGRWGEISWPVLQEPIEVPKSAIPVPAAAQPTLKSPPPRVQSLKASIHTPQLQLLKPDEGPTSPPLSSTFTPSSASTPPASFRPPSSPHSPPAFSSPSVAPVLPPLSRSAPMRQTWIFAHPVPGSPAPAPPPPASSTSSATAIAAVSRSPPPATPTNWSATADTHASPSPTSRPARTSAPAESQSPTTPETHESLLVQGLRAQERRRRTLEDGGALHAQHYLRQQEQQAATLQQEPQSPGPAVQMVAEDISTRNRLEQLLELALPCQHDWRLDVGRFYCVRCQQTHVVHFVSTSSSSC